MKPKVYTVRYTSQMGITARSPEEACEIAASYADEFADEDSFEVTNADEIEEDEE